MCLRAPLCIFEYSQLEDLRLQDLHRKSLAASSNRSEETLPARELTLTSLSPGGVGGPSQSVQVVETVSPFAATAAFPFDRGLSTVQRPDYHHLSFAQQATGQSHQSVVGLQLQQQLLLLQQQQASSAQMQYQQQQQLPLSYRASDTTLAQAPNTTAWGAHAWAGSNGGPQDMPPLAHMHHQQILMHQQDYLAQQQQGTLWSSQRRSPPNRHITWAPDVTQGEHSGQRLQQQQQQRQQQSKQGTGVASAVAEASGQEGGISRQVGSGGSSSAGGGYHRQDSVDSAEAAQERLGQFGCCGELYVLGASWK